MLENAYEPPDETPGLEAYYEAALIEICLICRRCGCSLDPDVDLGPNHSFKSDRYYVLLGNEAYRRGWFIEARDGDFTIFCPGCAIVNNP